MRIISLNGRPQCGKTHTLLALCDMLAKTTATLGEETCGPDKRMTFAMDGVIISVCTGGDNKEIIQSNIAYFERHHAAIAVTANRQPQQSLPQMDAGRLRPHQRPHPKRNSHALR